MKKLWIFSFALAVFSLQPVASAQTAPTPFMTVDAVSVRVDAITVTGVVQGEAAPSTRVMELRTYGTDAQQAAARELCHRQLLLALSKPGQYVVQAGPNLCNVALVAP
jgi:hypothetical protein